VAVRRDLEIFPGERILRIDAEHGSELFDSGAQVPGVTQGGSQRQTGRHKFRAQAQRGPVFGDSVFRVLSELEQLAQVIVRRGGSRVQLDGTTDRPDGSTYHITWSLGAGRKARESNDILREKGWEPLAPIGISLEPARF